MLTGNGNMGAMVFGRPYEETLVVNHCRLYLPQGNREIVQDFADLMPELKAAGLEAGVNGPQDAAATHHADDRPDRSVSPGFSFVVEDGD